ncbi:MAG TPA: lipid II flippase MurJ, partial [Verrucomicrobiae bacterium]|nr:lipid II flippase MurJ [Verrucomicrobiae bacterium]
MSNFTHNAEAGKLTAARRWLRLIRPSHQHSAFSATILLMVAMVLSRIVGYVREAYTAWAFGAGSTTDAYIAAFQIPDFLAYLVAGGTISITFVSIYTRFLAEKRVEDAQKTFSVIISVMTLVLGIGVILAEIFAPQITRLMFHNFKPAQLDLCVRLTRV